MAKPLHPICIKCELEMRPHTNGVTIVTMAYSPPQPYEAYTGDLAECPKCKQQAVSDGSFGRNASWMNGDLQPPPDIEKDDVFPVWDKKNTSP